MSKSRLRVVLAAWLFAIPVAAARADLIEVPASLQPWGAAAFDAPEARASCLFDSLSGTPTGNFVLQGPSANVAGNGITRLLAADLTINTGGLPTVINQLSFSVYNNNASAVSVRGRLRFWLPDGTPVGTPDPPGTYYNDGSANVGYTFTANSVAPGTNIATLNLGSGTFLWPASGTLWAGIVWDNNNGTTGATLAELNNFGQATFQGLACGASSGDGFITSTAGSFFPTANPTGSRFPLPLPPLRGSSSVLGWSVVPEPASLVLILVAVAGSASHRPRRLNSR